MLHLTKQKNPTKHKVKDVRSISQSFDSFVTLQEADEGRIQIFSIQLQVRMKTKKKKTLRKFLSSNLMADSDFRNYALRRTRDAFRENKNLSDESLIKTCVNSAMDNLEIVRRQVSLVESDTPHRFLSLVKVLMNFMLLSFQVIVGNLYRADKLIIEK